MGSHDAPLQFGSVLAQHSDPFASDEHRFLSGNDNASIHGTTSFASTEWRAGHETLQGLHSLIHGLWQSATPKNLFLAWLTIVIVRAIHLAIYRLYFHPLSKFPGPKLPAMTRLYEFYYQGIRPTEFPERILEMHQKYGPIVRISPEELSINDSSFNVDYFMKDRKLDKDPWYYKFGFDDSLFTLLDKDKHRHRQEHLAHHFAGAYFQAAYPMIGGEVGAVRERLDEFAASKETANVSVLYRKMSNEIQRQFLLGDKYPATKDYAKDAKTAYHPLFRGVSFIRHFPILRTLHDHVPRWAYAKFLPMGRFFQEAEEGIRDLIKEYDANGQTEEALLYRLLEVDPSYRDRNAVAAVEEFLELLWGGREVMGHAMTNLSYHLMLNPDVMTKLRAELRAAPFDITKASFAQLQKLPYLYGVCKEGIRLQLGGLFRIPRINKQAVTFQGYTIPAETPISMCPNFFHYDPKIFVDPLAFRPERWLDPVEREVLEHYWKPFGNGSRSCAGRNMALEVVFRTTANVFKDYTMVMEGLDADACRKDGLLKVFPVGSSKGLTVKVSKVEE